MYILTEQRFLDDEAESSRLWNEYHRLIKSREMRLPEGAYELASSDWYYTFSDHRAPHDAWLEWVKFEEPSHGKRNENRELSLRIKLLGAYHDLWLEFYYPKVYSYSMSHDATAGGQNDWLYDEFRISNRGNLLHEIEWDGGPYADGGRWIIEASDVQFISYARDV